MGTLDRIKQALDSETKNPSNSPYATCFNRNSSILDSYSPTGCYAADRPRCLGCRHFGAKTYGRDDGCPLADGASDGSSSGANSAGGAGGVGSDFAKKFAADAKPEIANIRAD